MIGSRRRRRSVTLLLVAAALIGGACGGPSQPTASAGSPGSRPAEPTAQDGGPFEPMVWPPADGAPCDQIQAPDATGGAYTGLIRRIRAVDPGTVEFELCAPDVAWPTRLAFAAFAINDTAWLESHIDPDQGGEQAIVGAVNGTGPYRLEGWTRGSEIRLVRNDAYWGTRARSERAIVRWRESAAARLAELKARTVDGIDDVGATDADTVEGDGALQAVARPGLNVFYVGFNDTYAPFDNPKVRQAIAMGLDRDRIIAANYPPGSEVASHFSPCAIPYGCTGEPWYDYDPAAARQLLADAGYPDGFATTIQYRDVVRPYLPDPQGVAAELQAQLLTNLNIRAALEVMPADTFLTVVDEGRADGIHLLGRSASIPEVSSLLDPHFGAGASREFGQPIGELVGALTTGAATIEDEARTAAYEEANRLLRANVPMIPIAHAGSMTAYLADVADARSSPVRYERFADVTPGDRPELVWLAASEPEGLYCADETAAVAQLVCSQVFEGLYAFEPASARVAPALAETCAPNPELTTWTCSLLGGVSFHDGALLDANDVVLSFAIQWDAEHPLHRGREGIFKPFKDTFGGLLNPPG
jgi:peptide/nickel transport system substrate-binding protein